MFLPSVEGWDHVAAALPDITYFTTANGGGMFSTSSISWLGSLSHNNYDNNVSRVTENVLRQFARDEDAPAI